MGDGALRGLPPPSTERVAERLDRVPFEVVTGILAAIPLGLTAVLGGVLVRGGDGPRSVFTFGGLANVLLRESLLRRPAPLSRLASGITGTG